MGSLVSMGRVCAIIAQNGDYAVFMFDRDLDGDANATLDSRVVNLDDPGSFGDGFAEIDPNFVILSPNCLSFCGRNSTLYMFQGICFPIRDASRPRPVGIYALELSSLDQSLLERKPERSKHPIMDLTKLKPVSFMVAPKLLPETVRCNQGIVVFSMEIQYIKEEEENDYMDESYRQHLAETAPISADFELFLPHCQKTVRLPQLSILRRQGHFYLERQSSPKLELVLPRSTLIIEGFDSASSFYITSFSVIDDGTTLVVGTGFGALFCLDIGLQQQPEWQVFHGSVLPHLHRNFVTANNKLVLCPRGACDFSFKFSDGDDSEFYDGFSSKFSDGGGSSSLVRRFPLSSSILPQFLWRNFTMEVSEFARLPQYVVCILQTGVSCFDQLHCTLDVLRLDASKFEEKEVGDHHQFAQRIKSIKFLGDYVPSSFCPEYCYLF